jgi:Domain of unknown function (DUF4062)
MSSHQSDEGIHKMTTNLPLSVFISSKMSELSTERRAVQAALSEYSIYGWLWDKDTGARPEPIRSTYLKEVSACDIYIGLFWLGYGPYTIEEYEYARQLHKPCLIYEKYINVNQRSPELVDFLHPLQEVVNPESLTVCRFETPAQIAKQVQTDVMRLLTTRFRESRRQPPPLPTSSSLTIAAKNKGIAISTHFGSANQYNYAPADAQSPRLMEHHP